MNDDLMTNDTARVEACLEWVDQYNYALDRHELSPNGDDYNALANGVVTILRDGIVPLIRVSHKGR